MTGMLILQLAGQFLFKSSMKELFGLFIALQLVCYFTMYDITLTSNAQIYTDEVKKLVEFDLFNPEKIVQRFHDPRFNFLNWLRGRDERHMTLNLDQEASILKDMKTIVAMIGLFIMSVTLALILIRFNGLKQRLQKMISKIKKSMLWSGTIRSLDILYLQIWMAVGLQINLRIKNSEFQSSVDWYASIMALVVLLIIPLHYTVFLTKYGSQLSTRAFKKQFEAMYAEVHNHRGRWNKYYIIVTMLRRMCFALIPAIFHKYDYMKVQLLCLLSSLYIIWYAAVRPHIWNRRFRMEIFNECMIMLFNYHMILFTDFCYDNKVQYLTGGSYQASILLLVFVNISMIITKVVESYKRKKHLDRLKDQYVLRMQEYREEKRQLAMKMKEDRHKNVAQWKHRRYVRAFLQDKMKVNEEEQPISAPFRLQKQIEDGYKKR